MNKHIENLIATQKKRGPLIGSYARSAGFTEFKYTKEQRALVLKAHAHASSILEHTGVSDIAFTHFFNAEKALRETLFLSHLIDNEEPVKKLCLIISTEYIKPEEIVEVCAVYSLPHKLYRKYATFNNKPTAVVIKISDMTQAQALENEGLEYLIELLISKNGSMSIRSLIDLAYSGCFFEN